MSLLSVDFDNKKLNKLISDLERKSSRSKKIVDNEINRAGINVETKAKQKITADGHIVTGRLRSSIHLENSKTTGFKYSDKDGHVYDGSFSEKPGPLGVYVGTNVTYAPKIEEIDSYLFSSFESEKKLLIDRLQKELGSL